MTPEQFERVQELFEELADADPEKWDERLLAECPDDEVVRQEVKRMLLHSADTVFGEAGDGVREQLTPGAGGEQVIGESIGDYRLMRRIGRGGMGTVFLAVRDVEDVRKRFAIKLVRRGLDTEDVLERFRMERKVLAALDHPYIARVYDAGSTEDGRPYLVMEYVEGQPIDRYCDANQLSTEDRLTLFRKVCEAVHFAHQNLVIHRDIKPSNILVTADGDPKLLDFGVAKFLNPAMAGTPMITKGAHAPMTPEYASPEQVRGAPVTTATDVYSLGVLLYELLTGRSPYRLKTRVHEEAVRIICEVEPEPPSAAITTPLEVKLEDGTVKTTSPDEFAKRRDSRPATLRRRLAGDLDNITLMAMEKAPQRRYASVEQFGEDIGRHLSRMPVIARRDSVFYRTIKFVGRHRAGVAAGVVLAVSLIGGIVGTTWQWREAVIAREAAADNAMRATERADVLFEFITDVTDWADDDRHLEGSTVLRETYLTVVDRYLKDVSFLREGHTDPILSVLQAKGQLQYALLQAIEQGSVTDARETLLKARQSLDDARAAGMEVPELETRYFLALARIERKLGHVDDAGWAFERGIAVEGPDSDALRRLRARARVQYGYVCLEAGDVERCHAEMQAGLDELRALRQARNDVGRLLDYSEALRLRGRAYAELGDFQEADSAYDRAIEAARQAVDTEPSSRIAKRDLMLNYEFKATMLVDQIIQTNARGPVLRDLRAEATKLLDLRHAIAGDLAIDESDARAQMELRRHQEVLGNVQFAMRDYFGALDHFEDYRGWLEADRRAHPRDVSKVQGLAALLLKIGESHRLILASHKYASKSEDTSDYFAPYLAADPDEQRHLALSRFDDCLAMLRGQDVDHRPHLNGLYITAAASAASTCWDDKPRAENYLRDAVRHCRILEDAGAVVGGDSVRFAKVKRNLAIIIVNQDDRSEGRAAEAVAYFEEAAAADGYEDDRVLGAYAVALFHAGDHAATRDIYTRLFSKGPPTDPDQLAIYDALAAEFGDFTVTTDAR